MQLEAGKYYKTRDGRKVGPLRVRSDGVFRQDNYEYIDGTFTWWEGGEASYDKSPNPHDLVSLWEEGPIRTVTRREIVPGVYVSTKVAVGDVANGSKVWIDVSDNMTAEELREAAHLFNQLAEVLENV